MKNTEYENFNSAMQTILRADPKAVKEAMEREHRAQEQERAAKGEKKRGRKPAMGHTVSLSFDPSEVKKQLAGLIELLQSRFPEGISDTLRGEILGLSSDVIFGELSATLVANGTVEVVQTFRFGSRFELLASTVRANK